MATSFSITAVKVIKKALLICGALGDGEELVGDMYQNGLEALQARLALLQGEASFPFKVSTGAVSTISGTNFYDVLSLRPVELFSVHVRDGRNLEIISQASIYEKLKDTVNDYPRYVALERLSNGAVQIRLFPTPVEIEVIDLVFLKEVVYPDTSTDSLDISRHWVNALEYYMASDLGDIYETPQTKLARIDAKAKYYADKAIGLDDNKPDKRIIRGYS